MKETGELLGVETNGTFLLPPENSSTLDTEKLNSKAKPFRYADFSKHGYQYSASSAADLAPKAIPDINAENRIVHTRIFFK